MDEPIRERIPSDAPAPPSSTNADEAFAGYLDELERICQAATPGPWIVDDDTESVVTTDDGAIICASGDVAADEARRDADFICAARHALPKLIAEVRRLQAEDTGVREHFATFCEWWCREKAQSEEAIEGAIELAERFRRGEVRP